MLATLQLATTQLAFIEGIAFDPFFRGLLSVLVGVVVLIGGTYLIVATNTGTRTGFLISMAGLFGWMFLMGVIWSIYGIGWRGHPPVWHLMEINVDRADVAADGPAYSEVHEVQVLGAVDLSAAAQQAAAMEDADEAQAYFLAAADQAEGMEGWRYLQLSDSIRGEAQAQAEAYLQAEHVFDEFGYVTNAFGGYTYGGKPVLFDGKPPENEGGLSGAIEEAPARVKHFFVETFLYPFHPEELIVLQFNEAIAQPTYPGAAPPVATANPEGRTVSVVMERDRGGPIPAILSGLRFTPVMFTIFNGLIFAVIAWALHNRDRRQDAIRAAAA